MRQIKILIMAIIFILIISSCGLATDVEPEDRILMANDKLYYGTTETGPMGMADAIAGEITSSVEANELPNENNKSNFGEIGAKYTWEANGFIQVYIGNEWFIFRVEKDYDNNAVDTLKLKILDSYEGKVEMEYNGDAEINGMDCYLYSTYIEMAQDDGKQVNYAPRLVAIYAIEQNGNATFISVDGVEWEPWIE